MRFLLIDNDLELLDELTQIILNIDPLHDIETCHSSFDALKKLKKQKFDIIMTEIYLQGGLQGDELIKSIPTKSFKVGFAEILENPIIHQPFNQFVMKPITEEHIKKIIKSALYNQQYNF